MILPAFLSKYAPRLLFGYKGFKGVKYPLGKGEAIVREAKEHYSEHLQAVWVGNKWEVCTDKFRNAIAGLKTVNGIIYYSQNQAGFDHRSLVNKWYRYLPLYIRALKGEFRWHYNLVDELGESPYSRPKTILKYQGKLVSNVFYYQLRCLLMCLAYVGEPNIVCEIGSGYGGLARLWLQNKVHKPSLYIDIDLPESLFFAEVFLGANFDGLDLLYITESTELDLIELLKHDVILCPINHIGVLSKLSMDLVINTGSLQEMPEEWVDFWTKWLEEQGCRWFYSLNMFAQPLNRMEEAENHWSPRLPKNWTTRHQVYNPAFVKLQSTRNFADIIAEKQTPKISKKALCQLYQVNRGRILDGQTLLEAMDIVRLNPDKDIIRDLIARCYNEMLETPKEVCHLEQLLDVT